MASSSRLIGFSTGALAKGDFRRALNILEARHIRAIELSALREDELPDLMGSISQLELSSFKYISVHTPTKLNCMSERDVVDYLKIAVALKFPVVIHPDIIGNPEIWRGSLRGLLLIENMDKRKAYGRTAEELAQIFERLPEAGFCCDVAHAAQVDPTMTEAAQMLRRFGHRLRQIHASGVSTSSGHGCMSVASSFSISRISHLIPDTVPIILESPVNEEAVTEEIRFAGTAFDPWLNRLRAEIDDVFNLKIPTLRKRQVANFLAELHQTGIRLNDFSNVIQRLPSGGAYKPGDAMLSSRDLFARLSETEKNELRDYLTLRIKEILVDFPELIKDFAAQFEDFVPQR